MTITPILWIHYALADNTYPLKIRHTYVKDNKKKQDYYPLNIYLKKHQWDKKSRRVKLDYHENGTQINLKLHEIEKTIELELLKNPGLNVGFMVQSIICSKPQEIKTEVAAGKEKYTVVSYFEKYVELCKAGVILRKKVNTAMTSGYLKTFNTTREHIEQYQAHINHEFSFDDITHEWCNKYVTYLRNDYQIKKKDRYGKKVKGMAENTIAKDIKNIKTVMGQAKKDKLHVNLDYQDFEASWTDVDQIVLTENEVKAILKVDTIKEYPELRNEQNRFSLAYNFLLRFTDSISVNEKHIFIEDKQPYLKLYTQKTKEPVIVPITKSNYKILKQNNFKLDYVANSTSNDKLKMLGLLGGVSGNVTITSFRKGEKIEKVYKKYELMSSHVTRRSRATHLRLHGVSLSIIKLLGGWKTEAQVEKYIRISPMENARMAAQMLPIINY